MYFYFSSYFSQIAFVPQKEAIEFLRGIRAPLSILCVCGKFRTGKSYLLNKAIIGKDNAFNVSPTIHACTKGIWMWKRPLRNTNKSDSSPESAVIVLDVEGLGSFEGNVEHDSKIIMLGILLSSLLIFNSAGPIDEPSLSGLSLVVEMAKKLQDADKTEGSKEFPSLLWVLRDFSLQLKDSQGDQITAKQYLENALTLQKGSSDVVESKNKIRRLLKFFFPERDCAVLVRPTEDEADLQNLTKLTEPKLRREFLDQLSVVKAKIKKRINIKQVNGKKVCGTTLADLCIKYAEAVNNGIIPSIENTWTYVCRAQCDAALNEVEALYNELVQNKLIKKQPMEKAEIKKVFEEIHSECTKAFNIKMLSEVGNSEAITLNRLLTKLKGSAKVLLEEKRKAIAKEYFNEKREELFQKKALGEFSQYKAAIADITKKFPKELKKGSFDICSEINPEMILETAQNFLEKATGELKSKIGLLEGTITHNKAEYEDNRSKLEAKVTTLQQNNKTFSDETQKMNEEIHSLYSQLSERNNELQKFNAEFNKVQEASAAQVESLKEALAKKEKEIAKLAKIQQACEAPLKKVACETAKMSGMKELVEKENEVSKRDLAKERSSEEELEHLQKYCISLEAKIKHERKFREVLNAASHLQCKECGQLFSCSVFAAHVKLCYEAAINKPLARTASRRKVGAPITQVHCYCLLTLFCRNIK